LKDRQARALFLLASCAARVDQCVPDSCSRSSSLRFLLLAARERGRVRFGQPDATSFFRDVEAAILDEGYNPLQDELSPNLATKYKPEVDYIRNEEPRYEADLRRAQILSVSVWGSEVSYQEWSKEIKGEGDSKPGIPFWQGDRLSDFFQAISEARKDDPQSLVGRILGEQHSVDGLLLAEPKCVFFKDWVRQDTVRSPRGKGFKFTGIAYNDTAPSFFFSLDPESEKEKRLHLYDLWVRLQEREGRERVLVPDGEKGREDVLARAENGKGGLFDPWYEGYQATIVVTPKRGLRKDKDYSSDVQLDPTMKLVADWAANSFYEAGKEVILQRWDGSRSETKDGPGQEENLKLTSFRTEASGHVNRLLAKVRSVPSPEREKKEEHSFLLGRLFLPENQRLDTPEFRHSTRQIGQDLWRLISPHPEGVPPDFESRHLLVDQHWVAVWNRHGIAMACKRKHPEWGEQGTAFAELGKTLGQLASIVATLQVSPSRKERAQWLDTTREAQVKLLSIEASHFGPTGRVLRPLLEATNLAEVSERIAQLAESYRDDEEGDRERLLADVLAVTSVLALGLSYLQVEGMGMLKDLGLSPASQRLVTYATGVALLVALIYGYGRIRGGMGDWLKELWRKMGGSSARDSNEQ
jgi:hypothetical protein